MSTLTSLVCLFIMQAVALMPTTAKPKLDVNPDEIHLGTTSYLDINCTFSWKDYPSMAAFISLIVSRANTSGQNYEELAVVTEFSPHSVTLISQEKVSAIGIYSETGESFVHLRWDYPSVLQAGVYECAAHGDDMFGHSVTITETFAVSADQANMNDTFDKLRDMENSIQMIQNTTIVQDHAISDMQKYIQDLQNLVAQMNSHITNLEDTVTSLRPFVSLNLLGTYKDTDYFVSKEVFSDINHAIDVCKSYGGQLVEINDEDEFKTVQELLKGAAGFIEVIIGGTDAVSEGNWLLPSNNKPMPFTAWGNGQPNGNASVNCIMLYYSLSSNWQMNDIECHGTRVFARYLCEIHH